MAAAAAQPPADVRADDSPLLPPPPEDAGGALLAPAAGQRAARWPRRFFRAAGVAALAAGGLAAAAALTGVRSSGPARAPSQRADSVQGGFKAALSLKQQYSGEVSGAPFPVPAPAPDAPCCASGSLTTPVAGPSIYCFALTMSSGGEVELLQYQLRERISLFACDEYQVFSNATLELGPDSAKGGAPLMAVPIGMSLEVAHGGRWGTALNTDVFVRLWEVVSQQGLWQSHDWSVKLDADAVFLPVRLRAMLSGLPRPGAKYLNNCKWGMHGPIEVVSREALGIYFSQMQQCEQIRQDAMEWQPVHWNEKMLRWTGTDKEHSFGEDQYLRRCFRLLQITTINEFKLLDELACGGNPKRTGCLGNYVTYHPFKEVDQYQTCLAYTRIGSAEEDQSLET